MNLFVAAPRINPADYLSSQEVRKLAAVKLTSSPGFWDDEIVQTLLRDHPYIPPQRVVVNFKRKDDTQGAAMGYVGITGAPQISIPVIIKNRELFPMDVIIMRSKQEAAQDGAQQGSGDLTDDKVLPLNEENFNRALDVGDIGESTPEHMTRGVGYSEDGSNLRLPFRGRTVLASHMGASEKQKEELGKILSQNKEAVAGFIHNRTQDVIDSWLNAAEPKQLVQSKLASAPVARSVAILPSCFPEEKKTADFMAAEIFVTGEQAKTAVCFNAIDLTSPISGEKRYLLFEDGSYCVAPEKVAILKSEQDEQALTRVVLQKTASGALHRGSVVSFTLDGNKMTAPAKIATICVNEQQKTVDLDMLDSLSRSYKICLTPSIKTATFDEKTGVWILPLRAEVLEFTQYAEQMPMPMAKVAEFFQKQLPDQLIHSGGQYTLILNREAFGPTQCDETKIAGVLNSWFENADELLKAAKVHGMIRFTSDITDKVKTAAKQADDFHDYPKVAKAAIADIVMPLDKAVKLAAAIGDPNGADSVLSAGFLNEDNLAEFVSLGDQFQETVGKLARLLLTIRMGFPGDESATVVAMKALQRVSDRLQSAVQEVKG